LACGIKTPHAKIKLKTFKSPQKQKPTNSKKVKLLKPTETNLTSVVTL
jgi:hypothetical protein